MRFQQYQHGRNKEKKRRRRKKKVVLDIHRLHTLSQNPEWRAVEAREREEKRLKKREERERGETYDTRT